MNLRASRYDNWNFSNWNAKEKGIIKKKKIRTFNNCGTISKGETYTIGIPEGEKKENEAKEIFEIIMAKKRYYSMDSESSENTNRINIKKYTFWYIIVKMQKVKANNSPLKQLEKSSTLPIWNKN